MNMFITILLLYISGNKVGLPDNLDRLDISFSLPLPDELLCHLYMVCALGSLNPKMEEKEKD